MIALALLCLHSTSKCEWGGLVCTSTNRIVPVLAQEVLALLCQHLCTISCQWGKLVGAVLSLEVLALLGLYMYSTSSSIYALAGINGLH